MQELAGYQIKEELYRQKDSVTYRARNNKDGKNVVLKTTSSPYPKTSQVSRIKHDYQVGSSLKDPAIIRYLDFVWHEHLPIIVIEDFDAVSLRQYCAGKPLTVKTFLDIGIEILNSMEALSDAHIIHKDIKPDNILIHPVTSVVKLTDFGISMSLARQNTAIALNPGQIDGTLQYISPEQTGRMNRPIDYRTDFYSLGITFYEMLAGTPPFESSDPLELVYAQLARQPKPLSEVNPQVPAVISEIISTLLLKTPEERYQSVHGIKDDLQKCKHLLNTTGKLESFKIRESDFSERFNIPSRLYGREKEIKAIVSEFESLESGKSKLITIAGYSGIGKTSLVMEAQRSIHLSKGNFVSGKFDQYLNNVPYSALSQAIGKFFFSLLMEDAKTIESWKKTFLEELGENAQLIIDSIPESKLILGDQKPVITLPASESEIRYNLTFKKMIMTLASKDHPLIIFLDDLQWADISSLKLMDFLLSDPDITHFFILGAYRDNEVTAAHPLMERLKTLDAKGKHISINLGPLSSGDAERLIADTLGQPEEKVGALAQLVYKKTEGNPFFLNRFLEKLYEDELFVFDRPTHQWTWSLEKISARNITENVVDLMLGRIRKLSPGTQDILKIASVLGNAFDLETLSSVTEESMSKTLAKLWDAVNAELVSTAEETYQVFYNQAESGNGNGAEEKLSNSNFRFIHDRIQQAAYSLLTNEEREKLHLRIGRLLLKEKSGAGKEEDIFEITNHLNLGSGGITNPVEIKSLATLNLKAGLRAKAANAISNAFEFFKKGCLLAGDDYAGNHETVFSLNLEKYECEYLLGYRDEPANGLRALVGKAKDKIEKIKVYLVLVNLHSKYDNKVGVVDTVRESMKMLGYRLPEGKIMLNMAIMTRLLKVKFRLRNQAKLKNIANIPTLTDPQKIKELELMNEFLGELVQVNAELWALVTLIMVDISTGYGQTDVSCISYVGYSIIILTVFKDASSAVLLAKEALRLAEKFGNLGIFWKAQHVYMTYVQHWKEHGSANIEFFKEIYAGNLQYGETLYANGAISAYFHKSIDLGKNIDEIIEGQDKYIQFFRSIRESEGENYIIATHQMLLALKGRTQPLWSLDTEIFNEEKSFKEYNEKKSFSVLGMFHESKLLLAHLSGDVKAATQLALDFEKLFPFVQGLMVSSSGCFHASLVLIDALGRSTSSEQKIIRKAIKKYSGRVAGWAKDCPENFLHMHLLISAEQARVKGDNVHAEKLYEEAILDARKNGFHQNEALANELAGKYFLSQNQDKVARAYLFDARYGYERWGATLKVQQMDERFRDLLQGFVKESHPSPMNTLTTATHTTTSAGSDILDLRSVMKASTAISGEIVLDNLLEKLMKIVIENAGANRGIFILKRDAGLFIEMEASEEKSVKTEIDLLKDNNQSVPPGIIRLVEKTGKDVVIDDAYSDPQFSNDAYILGRRAKFRDKKFLSVLCSPIANRGELKGILYLENDLSAGAFTEERVELLRVLSGQIAVSLENSINYENLEQKVKERTAEIEYQKSEIEKEKAKSERLLLNILPAEIAEELKAKGKAAAREYEKATILFSDIEGFTSIANKLTPDLLVKELDELFGGFDEIMEKYGLEKIKTIGDAYMAVGGVPTEDNESPVKVIRAAMEMLEFIRKRNESRAGSEIPAIGIRLGINTGPVVAGVVGTRKFAYDIWGDAVNLASRMESSGAAGKINISGETYKYVKDKIRCTYRGKIEAKNKGQVDMYFVEGEITF